MDRSRPFIVSRRQLVAGGAAALLAPQALRARPARDAFAIPLLGDLHFDRLEHHDMAWLQREKPNDVRQVQHYSTLTRERLPALFREVRATIAGSALPVPFVLHVGDFVEGLCGTPELALRHCEEAIAFVQEARLGVPFRMTKGNHDITGPGAVEAFDRVLLPWQARECGQELTRACVAFRHGEAEFFVFDAYRPDSLDWLERALERRAGRHVFLLIHPPVVPFGARSLWHIYSRPAQRAERERLLRLLGRHRAIVLCGHIHKYSLVARRTPEGRFVQLAVSSILPTAEAEPRQVVAGREEYGPELVRVEPAFEPATEAERREALRAEAPFIEAFEYADAPGYALLTVDGGQVVAEVYAGLGRRRWKRLDLTGLLQAAG